MLLFEYRMALRFSEPVRNHHFTLKCIPTGSARQTISHIEVRLSEGARFCENEDSFGNECIIGSVEQEHQELLIAVSGHAEIRSCGYESIADEAKLGIYRYPTTYTGAGESILSLVSQIKGEDCRNIAAQGGNAVPRLDLVARLMHLIHDYMTYTPGVTGTATTAEEAATLRQGVCQDYSHIMLGVLRSMHIPCRYVVGLLMGEGKSHAWVEVYCDGKWIGFDPTNDILVEDQHIVISHGRDAGDCEINRGVFFGNGMQTQEIEAVVSRV